MEQKENTEKPKPKNIHPKSEEVQAIIDRMPTRTARQVTWVTCGLVAIIITLGFVIKYPDTVDGTVSITSASAPVRLVAHSSGKLILTCADRDSVTKDQVVGYIDNGAQFEDVQLLKHLVQEYQSDRTTVFPETLRLGEMMPQFSRFELLDQQYRRFERENVYLPIQQNIERQIEFDLSVLTHIEAEIHLKRKVLDAVLIQNRNDSTLFAEKSISEAESRRRNNAVLDRMAEFQRLQTERANTLSRIGSARIELSKSKLEERDKSAEIESSLLAATNELIAALNMWQQKYEINATADGRLEFMDFWRDNSFVQGGTELFSVNSTQDSLFGEIKIPAFGAGKVKIGQKVNVKLNDYPFDEYGILNGVVCSIGTITGSMQTAEGVRVDTYRVLVYFPKNLTTSFDIQLSLNAEAKGTAEIITKQKQLIHRLFDNIKANTVQ